jgi:hypothetical protein
MAPYVFGILAYPAAQLCGLLVATIVIPLVARTAGLPVRRVLAAWAVLASAAVAAAILSAPSFPPSGGFRYPGVAVGVALALPFAMRLLREAVSVPAFGDALAAPLAFGLGVAKTACFFHGCCHGPRSQLPWAMSFPRQSAAWFEHVEAGLIRDTALQSLPVHPIQLYLAGWSVGVGLLLLSARRRKAYDGQLALLGLSVLMAGWFVHELVKVQPNPAMRVVALVLSAIATAALLGRRSPRMHMVDVECYPNDAAALALFADYYNAIPDGLVNDRFSVFAGQTHHDYVTPEFTVLPDISAEKFETVRGMGRGFGYNQIETESDYDSATTLIRLLVDVVSKNGNLLLNVGPMADGTIPAPQAARLNAIGAWLGTNGEAIFSTRAWTHAEGTTSDATPVRFTTSADGTTLYAIVLGPVAPGTITIAGLGVTPSAVRVLGRSGTLEASRVGDDLMIDVPEAGGDAAASVFAIVL